MTIVAVVTLLRFDEIQSVWVGYQLSAVAAMFVYRIAGAVAALLRGA
jgi:hypothetical protein